MRIVSADKCLDFNYDAGIVAYDEEIKTLGFAINPREGSVLMKDISKERAIEIMEEIRTAYKLGRTCYECPEE